MIDAEKLIAFALVTATTSLVPGQSMLFVLGQTIWRGARSGWAALLGMQIGYIVWWVLAGLGLGTLAAAYPLAFRVLAFAGIAYLAWLGFQAIRHSFHTDEDTFEPVRQPSRHAFRDGIFIAVGNPKSLIYMIAIIPPFVDAQSPVGPQIVILAVVALFLDLPIGGLYIGAGKRLARMMENSASRRWIDRAIGSVFLLISVVILAELLENGL
ncbi:LysE family translocator [Qipengyuania qiaonensis]|uniref:LysE family translocator n=1 Tax=Qipengyuania qiaonensis TaxID=2867240 RepID=A0ABS7J259_9SPHN|nr:LysE family translocator [Qipengyuania qiaonensis]MBX7481417.1 LysE family translocator [Qipengyuania qiaonensis]